MNPDGLIKNRFGRTRLHRPLAHTIRIGTYQSPPGTVLELVLPRSYCLSAPLSLELPASPPPPKSHKAGTPATSFSLPEVPKQEMNNANGLCYAI